MAQKTIYVSEDELTLWEQAGVLASRERRSTSWVIHEALRAYLREWALREDQRANEARAGEIR